MRYVFDAMPLQYAVNGAFVDFVQNLPSVEYAIGFGESPPANHVVPFQPTANAYVVNGLFVGAVQNLPSVEYARQFVPQPEATHIEPFHAKNIILFINIIFSICVRVIIT
jgi:hypothetical protein